MAKQSKKTESKKNTTVAADAVPVATAKKTVEALLKKGYNFSSLGKALGVHSFIPWSYAKLKAKSAPVKIHNAMVKLLDKPAPEAKAKKAPAAKKAKKAAAKTAKKVAKGGDAAVVAHNEAIDDAPAVESKPKAKRSKKIEVEVDASKAATPADAATPAPLPDAVGSLKTQIESRVNEYRKALIREAANQLKLFTDAELDG